MLIQLKFKMYSSGSYKIRGVANQFSQRSSGGNFVTISAGNYGKSFAYASKHYGTKGKVVMPETAPISRSLLIKVRPHWKYKCNASNCENSNQYYFFFFLLQSFGLEVERVPTRCQMDVVNRCVQEEKTTFLHPYNDLDVIAGHARYITVILTYFIKVVKYS